MNDDECFDWFDFIFLCQILLTIYSGPFLFFLYLFLIIKTVLCIAHRLDTILDSDRVCVMDAGRVVEYDAPDVLLKNEDSIFSGLVREMRERASGN